MIKPLIAMGLLLSGSIQGEVKVLAFSGSTRDGSFNQALISEAAHIASDMGANVTLINLKDYPMPYYNADMETHSGMPDNAKELRRLMIQSDVIFIASPEYNHSVSAVLKNAIDWASRKEGGGSSRDAFKGKKILLLSTSPGAGGGVRGLTHLKDIVEDIGGTVVPPPLGFPKAREVFDEQGRMKDPTAKKMLQQAVRQAVTP